MNDRVSVVLKGFPECVQRIADAIDKLLPGEVTWDEAAELYPRGMIMLTGRAAAPLSEAGAADIAA